MPRIEVESVRERYESIPDEVDLWHARTAAQLDRIVRSILHRGTTGRLLSAGAGHERYAPFHPAVYVDIAISPLLHAGGGVCADVHALPFHSKSFATVLCVGSVINYCDAASVIGELARVTKPGGSLVLEFESSASFEYAGTPHYNAMATFVRTSYNGTPETLWLYAPAYVSALLTANGFEVRSTHYIHIASAAAYCLYPDSSLVSRLASLDTFLRFIPFVRDGACNVVFETTLRH